MTFLCDGCLTVLSSERAVKPGAACLFASNYSFFLALIAQAKTCLLHLTGHIQLGPLPSDGSQNMSVFWGSLQDCPERHCCTLKYSSEQSEISWDKPSLSGRESVSQ